MPGTDRPRALFLAAESPYPMIAGGPMRAASLLHWLARSHDVDLVVFRQPAAPDPATLIPPGLVRAVHVIDLPHHARTPAARALRTAGRLARRIPPLFDRFSGFGDQIARAVGTARYEIGIVEHFWCAPYAEQLGSRCGRLVLDLHNVESAWHSCCAAAAPSAEAAAHRVFAAASERLERRWLPRYASLLAASREDASRLAHLSPGSRIMVYPNAMPPVPEPPRADENAVVFSGNFEYLPNIGAVRFFRGRIWPVLRERLPGTTWRLVGRNADAIRVYAAGDDCIEIRGPVDDAVAEIAKSRIAVVPLLAGSGTRFKILEAWAAGIPVVSTRIGAEGLPVREGQHALIADSPADFADAVCRLAASESLRGEIGAAGRRLFEREFTWDAAWTMLNI